MPRNYFVALCLILGLFNCTRTEKENIFDPPSANALTEVTQAAGIHFVHDPGVDSSYFFPECMGPGSAFFDYDNDGDQDIYFINGGNHTAKQPEHQSRNRLFRQEADGRFTDVTEESLLGDTGYGMGVAVGDIDNDGDLDVYLTNYGPDALYLNNGNGTFTNITRPAGVDNPYWGCSVIFFDYDLDGFLDIYVTNYVDLDPSVQCTDPAGRPEYCGPETYPGMADILYHNNGNGTFTDVSLKSRIGQVKKKGLGVVATDVNDDGYPDVYVANDGEENLLWINQKDGTFRDQALLLGVAVNQLGKPEAGMGIALGDANRDERLDFFITHFDGESNTLYQNGGLMGFQDVTRESGLETFDILPYTSFGVGFADLDLDGFLDIIIGNGRVARASRPVQDTHDYWAPYGEPNLIFRGTGNGRFENVSTQYPSFCQLRETTRGVAFADIDNDGDMDILLNNCGGPARLYRNDLDKKGNWLMITAYDPALKRIPVGTKITVIAQNIRLLHQVNPGYSYLCSNDYRVHFGLGAVQKIDRILVEWPGNKKEVFTGVKVNQHITLRKGSGQQQ